MTNPATLRQIAAADPARSTWLTANAGSGKTRVLTNRVARLLLAGTPPERILCLTYTRAAAAEMQNRLLDTLGKWAMLPEAELREALAAMGETAPAGIDLAGLDLAEARRLFARAIETPGGLKVQTIHAFCAAILRRFPIEAGVPVGFVELDERTDSQLRARIIEAMAEAAEPEITDLVTLHGDHDLDKFLAALSGAQARLGDAPDPAALWQLAGLPHPYDEAALLADTLGPGDRALLSALVPMLAAGSSTDAKAAAALAALARAEGTALLAGLEGILLFGDSARAPFGAKTGSFPTKDSRKRIGPEMMADLDALMERVEAARPRRIALSFAGRSLALHRFAARFNALYAAEKRAHGWLSFDDLIARTEALLSRASMAQWVLFRLDGGIDHILVDEAQDTSPEQWRVIRHLAAEFTAGEGARGAAAAGRTLFVVGDPKQSIYSFQGADIAVFSERRAGFGADFEAIGRPMQDTTLDHSFRSSPAILGLVDAVFAGLAGAGVDGPTRHLAFRGAMPGRVDLWPPVPAADKPELLPWDATDPQDEPQSPQVLLAEGIERQIAAMLGQPLTDKDGVTRPIGPGDILILVQRRSGIFGALLRVLKAAGHAVAGADRMRLTAELAVRDLRAVLAFLATPEDDLSLAAALRSPLFDVDEAALYRLAAGRSGYLWEALRDPALEAVPPLAAARAVLSDMLAASVTMRPHDLLARLLIRHDGRRRLLARLGEEAAEGIDELLSQALTYEQNGVPTLTGFLVWLGEDEIEVRRAVSAEGGGLIRVMTVHGAKGLESPIVILPECAQPGGAQHKPLLHLPGAPAVMRGRKGERPPQIEDALATEKQRQEEERRRLLYVALTRAESWLIVAAAGETGTGLDSWHAMVAAGFDTAAADPALTLQTLPDEAVPGCGPVRRLAFGNWPEASALLPCPNIPAGGTPPQPPAPPLPDWLLRPAAMPVPAPLPRAATALGGAKALPGDTPPAAAADLADPAALLFGTRLHLLLEHLPGLAAPDRAARATALLAGAEGGLPSAAALAALLDEAAALIDAPDLAAVFTLAPGETVLREVDWSADLDGPGPMIGTIDRLIVGPDRVLAVDYKSNHIVPDDPAAVPAGILRQMAAYRGALRAIWPTRRTEVAVLWTRSRQLMLLPDALLDRALAAVTPAGAG